MTDLLSLSPEELERVFLDLGEPKFRAKQVFAWLHRGRDFSEMTNLPIPIREQLSQRFIANPVHILEGLKSKLDGTEKYLFALPDGNVVEGVLMRYHYGNTVCISTQVGCKMGCAFCASTLEGCVRNLNAGEMLGEIIAVNKKLEAEGQRVGNVVMMGAGEPLDNYDNVIRFLRLLHHKDGLCIGLRSVSLSTCGICERIIDLADSMLPVTLSISLHAPNDEVRRKIMPIAKRYSMDEIFEACRYYIKKTGRRVIFEYAMIHGINADPSQAVELAARLRGMQCHVNLIPLNPVFERGLPGVTEAEVRRFLETLERQNISVTRRREMGDDIEGACGQLRRHFLKQNG